MGDARRQGGDIDHLIFVHLLRRIEEHGITRRLDLDDVGADLASQMGRIGADIYGGFALAGDHPAARVGPDDHGQTNCLRFFRQLADFLD